MSRVDVAVDVAVDVTVDVTVDVAVDVERLPLSRASGTSPNEMKGYSMEAVGRGGEDKSPFYKARPSSPWNLGSSPLFFLAAALPRAVQ